MATLHLSSTVSACEERASRLAHIGQRMVELSRELEVLGEEVAELADSATDEQPAAVAPRLVTVSQAAEALGIGQSTVHTLIRSGRLGSRKIGGARRIPVEALDVFVAELPSDRTGG